MIKNFIIMAAFLLSFMACQNAETPVNRLSSLANQIEENGENYTEQDWEDIAVEYEQIKEELSEYEYSDEELKEIGRLKGKISAMMAKEALRDFSRELENMGKQIEGGIDGFLEEMNSDDNN